MSTLFWCKAIDEKGALAHASDWNQHQCFVVKGKTQEANAGNKQKMPYQYSCTITCAFCGCQKHYEAECYHKQQIPPRSSLRYHKATMAEVGKAGAKTTASPRAIASGQGTIKGERVGPLTNSETPGGNPNPAPGRVLT